MYISCKNCNTVFGDKLGYCKTRVLLCVEEYFWNVPGLLRSLNSTFLPNKFKLNCKGKTYPEFQAVTGFLCDNLSISAVFYRDGISKYFSVCVCLCVCKSLKYKLVKEWWWVCDTEHCACTKSGWSLFFLLFSVPSNVKFLAVRRLMRLQLICIVTQKLNTIQQPRTEKSWSMYCTYCG